MKLACVIRSGSFRVHVSYDEYKEHYVVFGVPYPYSLYRWKKLIDVIAAMKKMKDEI